jgi:hypothetical protein
MEISIIAKGITPNLEVYLSNGYIPAASPAGLCSEITLAGNSLNK